MVPSKLQPSRLYLRLSVMVVATAIHAFEIFGVLGVIGVGLVGVLTATICVGWRSVSFDPATGGDDDANRADRQPLR
jgi:hypothetical protein